MKNKKLIEFSLYLFLLMIFSYFLVTTILSQSNTLEKNGNWSSYKDLSEYAPIVGGEEFIQSSISLANEKVNLSSWHGNQEIEFVKYGKINNYSFDFKLENSSFLYFFFDSGDGKNGYRISNNPLYPSTRIKVDKDGKFIKYQKIEINYNKHSWNHIESRTSKSGIQFFINGVVLDNYVAAKLGPKLSFKGAPNGTYIDNFEANINDIDYYDNFKNTKNFASMFFLSILILILLDLLIFKKVTQDRKFFITKNLGLVLSGLIIFIFVKVYGPRYQTNYTSSDGPLLIDPITSKIVSNEYQIKELNEMTKRISNSVGNYKDSFLFLGASQTFGEGASSLSKTWVYKVCAKLKSFKCVNGGIRSGTYKDLLEFYIPFSKSEKIKNIKYLFINLALNDRDITRVSESLIKILNINKIKNIETILILEPVSFDKFFYLDRHDIVNRLGKAYNVPVLDIHKELFDKRNSGLIWWDFIHLTDYGQEIFSNIIVKFLNKNIKPLAH